MSAFRALVTLTVRGLLGRRRTLLMLLLAALPVLVGLAIRLGGGRSDAPVILDTLVVRTVLPLVALVLGTAAIGSEIEDGTLVYWLVKPVARWRIALAKTGVAAVATIVLVIPPMLLTGVLVGGLGPDGLAAATGVAAACIVGATAYAAVFTALGVVTSRALILGLAYVLLWEGVLAGLLDGTRFLSIRQATLALAEALTGQDTGLDVLAPVVALAIVMVAIGGAFAVSTLALSRFQVRSDD